MGGEVVIHFFGGCCCYCGYTIGLRDALHLKRGIWAMMLASVVGPVEAIGCTVGTQKTFSIEPRHTM